LKGALGNLAATDASRTAQEIETHGRNGDLSSVEALIGRLEQELVRVAAELHEMSPEMVR
jgi:HPt (histidine-containing phosphotransfer) domain-containing protein